MKINVVTVESGWILKKIADRIMNAGIADVAWSQTIYNTKGDVDANLYVDISCCFSAPTSTYDVGIFTHLDKDSMSTFNDKWKNMDHIIHMSSKYYDMFLEKVPKEKMTLLYPFDVSHFPLKKPTIGIFQRGGYVGKGMDFMKEILSQEIAKNFRFLFVGKDWGGELALAKAKGVEAENFSDEIYANYQALYAKTDFVLIPSMWEGGPMAIVEALAQGIPIISADVGWANRDFPVDYIYPPGNINALEGILKKIIEPLLLKRNKVENINFKHFAQTTVDIIRKGTGK